MPLSLTSAAGIFLLALASAAGHSGSRWADLLFWLGLLALAVPIALRLVSPWAARQERIGLLVLLYGALYLDRDLNYPLGFQYNDEFDWFRGAQDLALNGHLFHPSPLLQLGPFYPGLAILTSALSDLTGLSIFHSGIIVLGAAGLLLVLSVYLFCEYVSGSEQVAGIATLLYAANPPFSGNIQFLYGALAIPLAAFVLFAVANRGRAAPGTRTGLTVVIWLALAAVVITHHVTSYELVGFLLLWTVAFRFAPILTFLRERRPEKVLFSPGGVAILGLALCLLWLQLTADRAFGYLSPSVVSTVRELMQVLATHHTQRHFFRDAAGVVEPRWEHLMGFAQVIVISLGLPFGLWGIWRRFRSNAAALALGLAALVYPVDQLARLAPDGTTTGSRMDAYAYLPVGFVLGVGLVYFWSHHTALWRYRIVLAGGLSVIFIGGWVLGTAPIWDRLPGPYVVAAQERSIDRQSVTAAMWVRSHLGPGHRVLTDRVNDLLMATYGDQWIVMSTNDNKVPIWPVFFSLHVDRTVEEVLRRTRVAYVVVDRRLSTGLPHTGFYYDPLEPQMGAYTTPIDSRDLAKFNGVPMVNEVFDSGGIHIYDVRAITKK